MGLLARVLHAVTAFLPPPRVIYALDGTSPYLSRWYLFGAPKMPDGSEPFNRFGNPRDGVVWDHSGGLYLHHFHRSDGEPELHNHPFEKSLALVLTGGYREERRIGNRVVCRDVKPGELNYLSADTFHRVTLLDRDAWTLFLVTRKTQSWGFWDQISGAFTPHREFFARRAAEIKTRAAIQAQISVEIPAAAKTFIDSALREARWVAAQSTEWIVKLRDVADDVLGIQPADVDPAELLASISKAYHDTRIRAAQATAAKYPGQGLPWADFLHHRGRALRWFRDEEVGGNIVDAFSVAPAQVAMILAHVDAHPELFPPEPAKPAKVEGAS